MAARPPSSPSLPTGSSKARLVCDILVRDKLLRKDQAEASFVQAQRTGDRVEDVVLEADMVPEGDMLRSLATHYKVNFISTEKLAKAEVARALINSIPQRFAEKMPRAPWCSTPRRTCSRS